MQPDFSTLLEELKEMCELSGDKIVIIGGVAVYLWTQFKLDEEPETSHDVDFSISQDAFYELKNCYDTTSNERLKKHQFLHKKIEFDVYVENMSHLAVDFQELFDQSTCYKGFRLASPVHLFQLKIRAAIDRAGSGKGHKDVRDLIKILRLVLQEGLVNDLKSVISKKEIEFLKENITFDVLKEYMNSNFAKASVLRKELEQLWVILEKGVDFGNPYRH